MLLMWNIRLSSEVAIEFKRSGQFDETATNHYVFCRVPPYVLTIAKRTLRCLIFFLIFMVFFN